MLTRFNVQVLDRCPLPYLRSPLFGTLAREAFFLGALLQKAATLGALEPQHLLTAPHTQVRFFLFERNVYSASHKKCI